MKHTIYSSGLRLSEALSLKISDIDSKRNIIMIRDAKGNKGRMALLSPKPLVVLKKIFKKMTSFKKMSSFSSH